MLTICILAGGKGKRIGTEKWKVQIKGKRLLDYATEIAIKTTKLIEAKTIIASGKYDIQLEDIESVQDIKGNGPLAGLYTALLQSGKVLILPCDMPFLTPELLSFLIENSVGHDITICRIGDRLQPQVGVYSKRCLPHLKDQMNKNLFALQDLAQNRNLAVCILDENELQKFGPLEKLFLNINTREDLEKAEVNL